MYVARRLGRLSRSAARALRKSVPSRGLRGVVPTLRRYQPLGAVPEDTDLNEVREKWGSNAMDLINETPTIDVDGPVATCDGGGGALGHPIEYIKLQVSDEEAGPQVCKYCGLRYKRKAQA